MFSIDWLIIFSNRILVIFINVLTTLLYSLISSTAVFMILGTIAATCLTYLNCMDHKNDAWGVDNVRSNSHLYQDLKYTIRTSKM